MSTISWQGGSGGDWTVAANWSGGAAPQAGDTVIIGDGADVFVETDAAALNITLGAGSTLEVASTLDLGGTLSGGSLNMTADNGDYWTATFGGALVGGTLDSQVIQAAPLNFELSPGLLDGVDYQGAAAADRCGLGDVTIDDGLTLADGTTFVQDANDSSGALHGAGTITLGAGASVSIGAMDAAATPTFAFTGGGAQLVLPGLGAGVTLDGFQAGDQLDLQGLSAEGAGVASAQVVGGQLVTRAASASRWAIFDMGSGCSRPMQAAPAGTPRTTRRRGGAGPTAMPASRCCRSRVRRSSSCVSFVRDATGCPRTPI